MALNKVTYTDDVTVIEAENLNDIQDAVIDTVPKSTGGTFGGNVRVDRENGTTSAIGESYFVAGNNIPSGTAKNSKGLIRLFSNQSGFTQLSSASSNGEYNCILPATSGTIALKEPVNLATTDDLNNLNQPNQSGTYYIQASAVNAPTSWASLLVIARPNGGCTQIVANQNYLFTRMYTGSPLAWSAWRRYISNPTDTYGMTQLTVTRVDNSFVNAEDFSRVQAFKKSGVLWCNFNLAISTGGSFSNFVKIGSISGWNSFGTVFFNIPGQNVATQSLTCYIDTTGAINIYSAQTITPQFFRASVVTLSND